ncbi:MAG: hypothetical protein VX821_08200, partial [Verrucomicrobiota bacterium]|nr:hypothetical protein [Verrucomicrobiota bacterium]
RIIRLWGWIAQNIPLSCIFPYGKDSWESDEAFSGESLEVPHSKITRREPMRAARVLKACLSFERAFAHFNSRILRFLHATK